MKKNYPKSIRIIEVGPRDGLQNEAQIISLPDKKIFVDKLIASGLREIEVAAFVHPDKVPQMAGSEELLQKLNESYKHQQTIKGLKLSSLVPNSKGLERALLAGAQHIAVFTAASDSFNKRNINMSIDESLNIFRPLISEAKSKGLSVRGYLSTCFVCPYEGNIDKERVLEISKALLEMGVDELSLGDTIGAAAPIDVYRTLGHLLNELDSTKIAMHFHDTYGTAIANVVASLELGITNFDSSAGGLGGCPYAPGASGNLATEDLVYLCAKLGIKTGVDLEQLAEAGKFMQDLLGRKLPSRNLARLLR